MHLSSTSLGVIPSHPISRNFLSHKKFSGMTMRQNRAGALSLRAAAVFVNLHFVVY
jgi:hypothetical protein